MGLPDEKHGEAVAAFVIKRLVKGEKAGRIGADEVRAWVKERLSHHLGEFL